MHLLMTSRKERDIENFLENYVKQEDTVCLQRDVVDKDIQRYVQQRLSDDKTLAKWNKDAVVRQEIEDALVRGAHGMFRWAVCQLDALARCRNRATLRKSLATLPQTLDQTYDRILTAISEEDQDYALRILQWLTFSARPLSVEEVAEVVAIDVAGNRAFNRDEVLEDPLEALNICSSLVTVTTNQAERSSRPPQRTIALAHYSVQEYLVSERIKQGQAKRFSMQEFDCHNVISKGSLIYLLQFQQPLSTEVLGASALARYAAEFWSSHIREAGDETGGSRLAMTLMSADNPAYLNWTKLYDPDRPWEKPDLGKGFKSIATPLYYTAMLGLSTITKLLLDKGAEVNAQGGEYGNALQAASYRGYEQVVKMLLDNKADVNAQGGYYGNALHAAAYGGREQILEFLISKCSISRLQDYYGRTLLWWAAAGGNIATVEALIYQHNIDPRAADRFGRKPSWIARKKGHGPVSILLDGYDKETDREQKAPPEVSKNDQRLQCDVCTSSISASAHHYHCNVCAGGDWDMCGDCRKTGATCVKPAHALVKRTMLDGDWVEVTS